MDAAREQGQPRVGLLTWATAALLIAYALTAFALFVLELPELWRELELTRQSAPDLVELRYTIGGFTGLIEIALIPVFLVWLFQTCENSLRLGATRPWVTRPWWAVV